MHTLARFFAALGATLQVVVLFGLWGVMASLATGDATPLAAVLVFTLLFFAPVTWAQAWDDFGD